MVTHSRRNPWKLRDNSNLGEFKLFLPPNSGIRRFCFLLSSHNFDLSRQKVLDREEMWNILIFAWCGQKSVTNPTNCTSRRAVTVSQSWFISRHYQCLHYVCDQVCITILRMDSSANELQYLLSINDSVRGGHGAKLSQTNAPWLEIT